MNPSSPKKDKTKRQRQVTKIQNSKKQQELQQNHGETVRWQ